ncbi:MAG: hypothetical protein OEU68_03700 [Nitrospira sp.]|nr:hypothetical protein [Nitrospira sp.]MDH4245596.1 hypothetical protein [Nitrospira sp.]MDH4354838.1 hypothetical protein [Nitrospira sp.]MDH5317088.1 hypothetical protein [Nitrospira sp.]
MVLSNATGKTWSEWAGRLLHTFVEAACYSDNVRHLLKNDPVSALRRWHWESDHVPKSLLPPSAEVSVTLNDETLLGPVAWRTGLNGEWLRQPQIRLVFAGAKPLGLIHGDERSLTALACFVRSRNYFTLLSPHQFLPQSDSCKGGYSNRMRQVGNACAGSGAWRGLLIAADEQTVLMAWLCQLFGWEGFLGRLLGYPLCCCEAFESRWPIAAASYEGDVGLMLLAQSASGAVEGVQDLEWTTNIFARYFGWEIIQHFPCRFDCPATTMLAHRYASVLLQYWPHDTQEILRHLSCPLLVTADHGCGLFPGGRVTYESAGVSLHYDQKFVQFVGMGSKLTQHIASTSRLPVTKGGIWKGMDANDSGWILNIRSIEGSGLGRQ